MLNGEQLFLGIDGGGTKCKARLETYSGELLGEGLSGPANPAQNASLTCQSITEASQMAIANAGLPVEAIAEVHAALGLAGVNIPKYLQLMQQWQHPFKNCLVTTDLHIACLGAHGGQEGAILITGTGSSAFASVADEHTAIGGHGFPLGDKGSGAWLGWRALNLVLESLDQLRPTASLVATICEQLECTDADQIVSKSLHFAPIDYAKLAPLVIQSAKHGDVMAVEIMQEGARYLQSVLGRLITMSPQRISMIGGLSSAWMGWFPDPITRQLQSPLCSPEYGAVALARKHFKEVVHA